MRGAVQQPRLRPACSADHYARLQQGQALGKAGQAMQQAAVQGPTKWNLLHVGRWRHTLVRCYRCATGIPPATRYSALISQPALLIYMQVIRRQDTATGKWLARCRGLHNPGPCQAPCQAMQYGGQCQPPCLPCA